MKILVDKNKIQNDKNDNMNILSREVNPGDCYTPFCRSKCIVYIPSCKSFANVYPFGDNKDK